MSTENTASGGGSQSDANRSESELGQSLTFSKYLKLDKLLSLQRPKARDKDGKKVHDEHLFIIVHQAYELWFNQLLCEVDSVRELFNANKSEKFKQLLKQRQDEYRQKLEDNKAKLVSPQKLDVSQQKPDAITKKAEVSTQKPDVRKQPLKLDEIQLLTITSRLQRCVLILRLLVEQFAILETVSPLDFLEFRSALDTSSGFESWQFRLLELKLGLVRKDSTTQTDSTQTGSSQADNSQANSKKKDYKEELEPEQRKLLEKAEKEPSLSTLVQRWLERTPGLERTQDGFDFWQQYKEKAEQYLDDENKRIDPELRKQKLDEFNKQKEAFHKIFSKEDFEELVKKSELSFLFEAFQGAMLISLYRNEPRFHLPYMLLTLLVDVDELIAKWHFSHMSMLQRMTGMKTGSGGSLGYPDLNSSTGASHKVFQDLSKLSAYLLPLKYAPKLSHDMKQQLSVWMRPGADFVATVPTTTPAAPVASAAAAASASKEGHNV